MNDTNSLRQRKIAKAKLALLNAAIRALDHAPLETIRVRDLCAEAEVSEASFFNYFSQKNDLLVFFILLWSLEMAWQARRLGRESGGLAAIEGIFSLTAERIVQHPNVMAEIIAFQARTTGAVTTAPLSVAERVVAFPDLEDTASLPTAGLQELLPPLFEQAVAAGELPRTTDRTRALVAAAAIFFAVPILLRGGDPQAIGPTYHDQLQLLWAGLRAAPERKKS